MNSVPAKRCCCCKAGKAATTEFFYKNASRKDGLSPSCKDCKKAENKVYREINRSKIATQQITYRVTKLPTISMKQKAYRDANIDKERMRERNYRKANLEKVNAKKRRYRARKRNAEGTHTAADVAKQFTAQKGRCWWCGNKLKVSSRGKYEVDHVVALSKGGSNNPENLVCACPACNSSKNSRTPLDFIGRLF